jgi:segregation and condensation protein A
MDIPVTDYRVHLQNFDGPLDLLLHLIRKAEVDITDIPIATIADQYIEHVRHVDRLDIELAGEFLLMAATLMEIKSRMLAPVESRRVRDAGTHDDDDPRADLVRQLLEYKAYRDAAEWLDERREQWSRRMGSAKAGLDRTALEQDDELDLGDVDVVDLLRAFESIAESVNFDRLGEHEVLDDDTPVEFHAEDILDRLRARSPLTLADLLRGRSRSEMIGLFLATLELVRRRAIGVEQQGAGRIALILRGPQTDEGAPDP